ncbi:lipoprotein N-acyltransferase Lnb domain-containing protein [Myroides sp. LJL115]
MNKLIYIFFSLLFIQGFASQDKQLSARSSISILTCGTGDASHALYGHTAVWVQDPLLGIDRVYNYGLFDFETPNFVGKFIGGNLFYFADYTNFDRFVRSYVYENRSVYKQELDLSSQQKQMMYGLLNQAILPESREFLYQFIQENCTTKVVDLLQEVLDEKLKVDVSSNQGSYRSILSDYVKHSFFEDLGINILLGAKTDKKSELVFLPFILMESLDQTKVDGKSLVKESSVIFQAENTLKKQDNWINSIYFFYGILFIVGYFCFRAKLARKVVYTLYGCFGIFLLALTLYSSHSEFALNASILLFNPLFLVLVFNRKSSLITRIALITILVSLVLYVGLTIFSVKFILTLGLFLLTLVSLFIDYRFIFLSRKLQS